MSRENAVDRAVAAAAARVKSDADRMAQEYGGNLHSAAIAAYETADLATTGKVANHWTAVALELENRA